MTVTKRDVDKAYNEANKVAHKLDRLFVSCIPSTIKKKYPEIRVEARPGYGRLNVTVIEDKYHWATDVFKVYVDYPYYWKDTTTEIPKISFNHGSGGYRGAKEGFSDIETMDNVIAVFTVGRNVMQFIEDNSIKIHKLVKEYTERSDRASSLYSEHDEVVKAKLEKKTEKEVLKVVRQFQRIRSFEELEKKLMAQYVKNEWRTPCVQVMGLEIYRDEFRVKFDYVEMNPYGKRTTFRFGNEGVSKKNLTEFMKRGYGFYHITDDMNFMGQSKMQRNSYKTASNFISDFKNSMKEVA